MTKERLKQIMDERDANRSAYEKDGWKYFEEALPMIQEAIEKDSKKKK